MKHCLKELGFRGVESSGMEIGKNKVIQRGIRRAFLGGYRPDSSKQSVLEKK